MRTSIVKIAKVGKGLVKVVGKGVPVAVPNGAASIGVQLYFGDATNAYCMRFTGGTYSANQLFQSQYAPAPVSCA